MEYTRDVYSYDGAIVDNTDPVKRIVILTDIPGKAYKQLFFVDCSDSELIERCKQMRDLKINSF